MDRFHRHAPLWSTILALSVALLAATPVAAGETLSEALKEYERISRELNKDQYRAWVGRLDQAIAGDPKAAPNLVYWARLKQAALCQWLSAWDEALHYADVAASVASTPEERFEAGCEAARAALEALPDQAAMRSAAGERLLARYAALQEQVEGPDGLAARCGREDTLLGRYLSVLSNRAWVLKERGALAEACAVYDNALKMVRDRPLPADAKVHILNNRAALLVERGAHREALELYEEALKLLSEKPSGGLLFGEPSYGRASALHGAMICAAHCKDTARAERFLLELVDARAPAQHPSVAAIWVEDLAQAEGPIGAETHEARLKWWLGRVGPTDPTWAPILFSLARSQGTRVDSLVEEVRSLEQLLSAYEKNPPPDSLTWPAIQKECWARLAELYAGTAPGRSNPPRARELAQRYLDATRDDKSPAVQPKRAAMLELLRTTNPGEPR